MVLTDQLSSLVKSLMSWSPCVQIPNTPFPSPAASRHSNKGPCLGREDSSKSLIKYTAAGELRHLSYLCHHIIPYNPARPKYELIIFSEKPGSWGLKEGGVWSVVERDRKGAAIDHFYWQEGALRSPQPHTHWFSPARVSLAGVSSVRILRCDVIVYKIPASELHIWVTQKKCLKKIYGLNKFMILCWVSLLDALGPSVWCGYDHIYILRLQVWVHTHCSHWWQ